MFHHMAIKVCLAIGCVVAVFTLELYLVLFNLLLVLGRQAMNLIGGITDTLNITMLTVP
jgi:hypothetical protein